MIPKGIIFYMMYRVHSAMHNIIHALISFLPCIRIKIHCTKYTEQGTLLFIMIDARCILYIVVPVQVEKTAR